MMDKDYAIVNWKDYFGNHPIPFIKSIFKRIYKKKQNCMILVVGDTGTGKSYIALKICHEFDPHGFNHETIAERCLSKPNQFIDLIVDGREKLKFGSAFMPDEAGTSTPSREWYTFNNKAINYLVQTFRYKKLLGVWTVPSIDLIDKQLRKFFHYLIIAERVDIENRINQCKIYELSYAKKGKDAGKIYYKYPRYMKGGTKVKITKFYFKATNPKLLHAYEKYSQKFKGDLAIDLKRQSEKIEKVQARGKIDVQKIAEEIIINKKRYFYLYGNKWIVKQNRVELDFGVGGGYAKRIKELAEQKSREMGLFRIREAIDKSQKQEENNIK